MSAVQELRVLLERRLIQLVSLVALLGGAGILAFRFKFCVTDYDVWWHLKVGDWILEHMAVPHTGILSSTAAARPWVAYSWGYEVMLSRAYAWFGLLGIGLFGVILTILVAYFTYWMLLRISGRFWLSMLWAIVACTAFLYQGSPRPFFFSMMLFSVVLALLLEANRTGRVHPLYWLPLLFVIWANLHIQFIYGLFPVGLLMALCVAQPLLERIGLTPRFLAAARLPAGKMVLIFAACFFACMIGPNFYHPYVAVLEYSKAKFSYEVISELQPLSFRDYREYVELLTAGAAFYAIGWQKKIDPFKLLMMIVASVLAFRTLRDAWFLCLIAVACVGDVFARDAEPDTAESWLERLGMVGGVALLLALTANATNFTARELDRAISANYPVDAINFLRRNPVPGPLYNDLNFGGFLMWYLPQYPVAIDGRNDLYGDDLDRMFYASQSAEDSYRNDPYLNDAGLVLLGSEIPLAKVLSVDPRFELIYRDGTATMYRRRQP